MRTFSLGNVPRSILTTRRVCLSISKLPASSFLPSSGVVFAVLIRRDAPFERTPSAGEVTARRAVTFQMIPLASGHRPRESCERDEGRGRGSSGYLVRKIRLSLPATAASRGRDTGALVSVSEDGPRKRG